MAKWRREKRLTEYPLPEALEVSFQRSQQLSKAELLVWIESTAMNVDRLLTQYRNTAHADVAWDVYHHALQLVGMTRSLVEHNSPLPEL